MHSPVDPHRRAVLTLAAAAPLALGITKPAEALTRVEPQVTPVRSQAFQSATVLRPLTFDPSKLKGLSERLIRSHWENNYGGSVKALSVAKEHLAQAMTSKDMPPFLYNQWKREHLLRTGSVVLHEHYFDNLGGNGQAGAVERKVIAESFGSFDAWETEFRRIATGLGGGSGWVVLGYNTHLHQFENYWMADHAHSPAATIPILVMDMYEHAYQMDYGAAAGKYIDVFFQNIQWEAVAKRLSQVTSIAR
jgi:superoxide dismutase, Fe-Mn family